MDREKVLQILDELITSYMDDHKDEEDNFVMDNIDDFEMFIEKVLKSMPIE